MVTIKPLPNERSMARTREIKRVVLNNFTVRAISKNKINAEEMAYVAAKVASMLGKKKTNLSNDEINTAIDYIRFLLSKMHLLKTKRLVTLARELFSPGEARKTKISAMNRPRRPSRIRK